MTVKQETLRIFLAVTALIITAAFTTQQDSIVDVKVASESALITKSPKQLTKKQIARYIRR